LAQAILAQVSCAKQVGRVMPPTMVPRRGGQKPRQASVASGICIVACVALTQLFSSSSAAAGGNGAFALGVSPDLRRLTLPVAGVAAPSKAVHLPPMPVVASSASNSIRRASMAAVMGCLLTAGVTAFATTEKGPAFTGSTSVITKTSTDEALTAMSGVKRRPHKRISERTHKDWLRMRRRNTAAMKRYLIRPDGTIWRRQAGLRHLVSKKSKAHVVRLRRMVEMQRKDYKRLLQLLGKRPPVKKASDYIMRRFNEARLKKGDHTNDRGVGTSLFC